MRPTKLCQNIAVAIFIWLIGATAANAALVVPPDLNPGDTYQLVFVTSALTSAISSDISDYNDLVQLDANNNGLGGVTWSAIASTSAVSATDNAPILGPLYNMNGDLVATSANDLWDTSLSNPIGYDAKGDPVSERVWTGTQYNGSIHYYSLGSLAYGMSGLSDSDSTYWIQYGLSLASSNYRLYAVSEELTVTTPVPTTLLLLGSALSILGFRERRKRNS
jgi:hypothetical protein